MFIHFYLNFLSNGFHKVCMCEYFGGMTRGFEWGLSELL